MVVCLALVASLVGTAPASVLAGSDCYGHWGSDLTAPDLPTPTSPPCDDDSRSSDPFGPMTPVIVNVNGAPVLVAKGEQGPYRQGGRVFVPIRYVAEALGATVTWLQDERTALLRKGDRYVAAIPGAPSIRANGWTFATEAPTRLINGRLFVPIRYVVEGLGGSVAWDESTQTAWVSSEPTRFDLDTLTKLALGVIQAIADKFRECDSLLCLDRDMFEVPTTPAVWEQTYAHIDFANQLLRAARDVEYRVFVKKGKLYIAKASAAGLALGAVIGETATNWAGFLDGLKDVGLTVSKVPPVALAPAVVIGVLAVPGRAGMSAAEENALVKEADTAVATASTWQESRSLTADRYFVCYLNRGDIIYGLWEGQSPFYTDAATVLLAQGSARILAQLLQVTPSRAHGGYRKFAKSYNVLISGYVACGKVGANTYIPVEGFGLMFAGYGGGWQYFIPDFGTRLRGLGEKSLTDWEVTNWDALRP